MQRKRNQKKNSNQMKHKLRKYLHECIQYRQLMLFQKKIELYSFRCHEANEE